MSLIVKIQVNECLILWGSATRIKPQRVTANTIGTYRLHDGSIIKHRYGDGAKVLAKMILEKIIENPDGQNVKVYHRDGHMTGNRG